MEKIHQRLGASPPAAATLSTNEADDRPWPASNSSKLADAAFSTLLAKPNVSHSARTSVRIHQPFVLRSTRIDLLWLNQSVLRNDSKSGSGFAWDVDSPKNQSPAGSRRSILTTLGGGFLQITPRCDGRSLSVVLSLRERQLLPPTILAFPAGNAVKLLVLCAVETMQRISGGATCHTRTTPYPETVTSRPATVRNAIRISPITSSRVRWAIPTPGPAALKSAARTATRPPEVAVDTALTDLTCSSCGSHFSLVDQSKAHADGAVAHEAGPLRA